MPKTDLQGAGGHGVFYQMIIKGPQQFSWKVKSSLGIGTQTHGKKQWQ
jgi:hypothetical protein